MVSSLVHRDQSRVYLEQANKEFAEGDDMQAAEKGWGAAAQMIKALAEERGWEHGSHWLLSGVISRVVEETGDDEFRSLYALANQLHTHFYEGWLTADLVERSIQDVARFVEKLEALLEAGVE
jgi:hypothetical protein